MQFFSLNLVKPFGRCACMLSRFSPCLILCDPMDCSPPGFCVRGDFPGKSTAVGCHLLLQGIFLTQRSNLHLLSPRIGRQVLYHWASWEARWPYDRNSGYHFLSFIMSDTNLSTLHVLSYLVLTKILLDFIFIHSLQMKKWKLRHKVISGHTVSKTETKLGNFDFKIKVIYSSAVLNLGLRLVKS